MSRFLTLQQKQHTGRIPLRNIFTINNVDHTKDIKTFHLDVCISWPGILKMKLIFCLHSCFDNCDNFNNKVKLCTQHIDYFCKIFNTKKTNILIIYVFNFQTFLFYQSTFLLQNLSHQTHCFTTQSWSFFTLMY